MGACSKSKLRTAVAQLCNRAGSPTGQSVVKKPRSYAQFAELLATGPPAVVVDVTMDGCPPSRAMEPIFEVGAPTRFPMGAQATLRIAHPRSVVQALARETSDVTFIRVNVAATVRWPHAVVPTGVPGATLRPRRLTLAIPLVGAQSHSGFVT